MGNPRQPAAKASMTGAASKNPQRHRNRKDPPQGRPLGEPSDFLDDNGKRAWEGFKRELPWLLESDRAIVEIAAKLRGLILSGADVGEGKMKLLQTILSKLGASPSDRTKIAYGSDEEERDDLLD